MCHGQKGRRQSAARHGSALNIEIAALAKLSMGELRNAWTTYFREDAPGIRSRDIVARVLAWRIQAAEFGGLNSRTQRQLRQIANALERDGSYEPQIRRDVSPGVELTREWKGMTHKVTVTPEGFRYDGRHFRSLSDVARTITGTRWSGPRFFGLEDKPQHRSRASQTMSATEIET